MRQFQLTLTLVVLLCATSLLCGCGTIKAYPGPELPENQIAIVTRKCLSAGELSESSLDGIEFCSKDIAVLPGNHKLYASRVVRGQPTDCRTSTRFDSSGYDSCRDDREEDIRKGRIARSCDTYSYTSTVTECQVQYTKYSCEAMLSLRAGDRYTLSAEPNDLERGLTVFSSTGGRPLQVQCIYHSTWTNLEQI